ncbi:SAM-dependent methyltransferase [Crossiella equi]|uniref:SAM-dependent methyltransferase n=1 Tax=Crossiella equi TaxID=130796 RepID=A0ABS5AS68_9PSEU|nr:class I SAM-dependent methyltransferase [Crossiella equi]MBP2479034.1 SAM-dependent methyltransferase [Crossiella equi]
MPEHTDALTRWGAHLSDWVIPDEILAATEETPWVLPRQVFRRRARTQLVTPSGVTYETALAALTPPGSVLDVGAGAGATSLPLLATGRVTSLTAVDADAELLDACAAGATALGMPVRTLPGFWPTLAEEAGTADVVVCGNVLYNVPELAPFVRALTAAARRLVVVETAARHPLIDLNPLWRHFHGIDRPEGPTVDHLLPALAELGVTPEVRHWRRSSERDHQDLASLVETTRRRLCLPPSAREEVERVLRELALDSGATGRAVVTLSWPGEA